MTALTPARPELVALAVATTEGAIDGDQLTRWLLGHQQAGIPWPDLWRIVDQWLWTGGRQMFELDDRLAAWRLQHPTRQGARP